MFYKQTNFKETAIGKIPTEWTVGSVKELGEVITGTTPRTSVKEYWNGEYPFVTPTDMTENKYIEKTERGVTEKGLRMGRLIPKDSVLVTCIASIGKIALASKPCITNQQINAIVCKQGVDSHYVYYAVDLRNDVLKAWAGRTTNRIVKKSLFEKFLVPLPPLSEQKKIAEVLSTVDEAIQKTSEVIAKTERLKKGLMQELLTKGIGHKEFKDTEIGRIPKEWEVVKLGEIATEVYRYPTYYNIGYEDDGVPEVRGELIKEDGELQEDLSKYRFISKETSQRFPRTILREGDFILSVRGTMGKIAIVPRFLKGANITANLMRVSLDQSKCFPSFFKQVFLSDFFKKTLGNLSSQTTIKTIQAPVLKSITMPLPSLPEQRRIAEILFAFDQKLELERNEKARLERIKQGMMDLLLTGKVRVKV